MVKFLDDAASLPEPEGWVRQTMRLRMVSQPYPSFCPKPEGRAELPENLDVSALRSFGVPPTQSRGSERVIIYRELAWTVANPRHKRWYYQEPDVEYIEDLLEELMRDDEESYLARQIEYSDAEDQKTFCRLAFKLWAQGPIVERLEALTLVNPKADGGFWVNDRGPYYVDFLDRPRYLTLRLAELPPKVNPDYLAACMEAAGYEVTDARPPPAYRGIVRDDQIDVTVRLPPNTGAPAEVAFSYHGRRLLAPVRVVRDRSLVYAPEELTSLEQEEEEGLEQGQDALAECSGDLSPLSSLTSGETIPSTDDAQHAQHAASIQARIAA